MARAASRISATTALFAAGMTLAGAATAQDKVHFQYSWIPTGEYAPYSAGLEKGFFKEQGIDLTYSTGRGSGDAVKKVAGGGSPFGDGDISSLMAARVREKESVGATAWQPISSYFLGTSSRTRSSGSGNIRVFLTLKESINAGSKVPLSLVFKNSGSVDVIAVAR